jgi:hypothetical protein
VSHFYYAARVQILHKFGVGIWGQAGKDEMQAIHLPQRCHDLTTDLLSSARTLVALDHGWAQDPRAPNLNNSETANSLPKRRSCAGFVKVSRFEQVLSITKSRIKESYT